MAGEFTSGGVTAIVVSVLVDVLATASTIVRVLNRRQTGETLQRDDVCIIVGWLCSLAMTVNIGLEIHWAFRLDHELSKETEAVDMEKFLLVNYVVECFYTLSIALAKISIIFFYLRTFGHMRWMQVWCYATAAIVVCWTIACELVGIFQCTPVRRAWQIQTPGTCINLSVFFVAQRATNLVTDVILLSLPIKVVLQLHTSLAKRISLVFAFIMGGLVCIASAYALALTVGIIGRIISFSDYRSLIWTVVELEIGVFCANMPFCYPLLLRCIPNRIKGHVADGVEGFASKRRAPSSKGYTTSKPKLGPRSQIKSWVHGSGSNEEPYGMDELERASVKSDAEILTDKQAIYIRRDYEVAVCEEAIETKHYAG